MLFNKKATPRLRLALIAVLSAGAGGFLWADSHSALASPASLTSKIDAAQNREAFLKIFDMTPDARPSPKWASFLAGVERGDKPLEPALLALSKKNFWLSSPDMTEALSHALLVRPAFVLKVIGGSSNPGRSSEVICRLDPPYGATVSDVDAAHRKAYKALGGVAEESLASARHACFESLARHQREWKELRRLGGDAPLP